MLSYDSGIVYCNTDSSYSFITEPVLKCSIFNGEQVAGFVNIHTNVFEDIMLIKSQEDLKMFKEQYGITEDIEKIY